MDEGQSKYPLEEYMELIGHDVRRGDGGIETQEIKCTRNAAASIALVSTESSYEKTVEIMKRLTGLELTAQTIYRITDSVGAEYVKKVPWVEDEEIEAATKKISGNILEARIEGIKGSAAKDEMIKKALEGGLEGVYYKEYEGPRIRVMYILGDGTGVPGRRQELIGVLGKQPDGSAKTFEAKIGAVFTVEYTADGRPLLDEKGEIYRDKKVNYMGTTRKVEDFGPMLYQHAVENGLDDMDAVIFLGDGAKWLWGIQNDYFPGALTCLDLYHSTERLNDMIDLLQFKGRVATDNQQDFKDDCFELLRTGNVSDMLDLIVTLPPKKGNEKKLDSALAYFRSNLDRMHYGLFSAVGIFVGSGVIEAACKLIVGNRLKNAGMHWSKDHADKMINLRCAIKNRLFLDSYLCNYNPFSSRFAIA
jgi:hypothetical protein